MRVSPAVTHSNDVCFLDINVEVANMADNKKKMESKNICPLMPPTSVGIGLEPTSMALEQQLTSTGVSLRNMRMSAIESTSSRGDMTT